MMEARNRKKMSGIVKWILKCGIASVISLVILSLFVLIYHHTGVHITNTSGATDYKWEANQYKSSMVEGFTWLTVDEHGFNNAYEVKKPQIDILLMGSSHMEALEVSSDKNVGYLLNEMLPEKYTYNIGTSGHTIYTCAKNMQDAVEAYQPQEYVILEIDRVDLSVEDMVKVINEEYATIPSYDEGIMYWMQKTIPASKEVYNQLDLWMSKDEGQEKTDDENEGKSVEENRFDENYRTILSDFLDKAYSAVKNADVQLIIFYQPTTALDENGKLKDSTDTEALNVFKELCEEKSIIFVDMTDGFERLYYEENKLAHGFCNTAVGAGHLNEDGHHVIAEALVQTIEENQKEMEYVIE